MPAAAFTQTDCSLPQRQAQTPCTARPQQRCARERRCPNMNLAPAPHAPHLAVAHVAVGCRHQLLVAALPRPALGLLALGLLGDELQLVRNDLGGGGSSSSQQQQQRSAHTPAVARATGSGLRAGWHEASTHLLVAWATSRRQASTSCRQYEGLQSVTCSGPAAGQGPCRLTFCRCACDLASLCSRLSLADSHSVHRRRRHSSGAVGWCC